MRYRVPIKWPPSYDLILHVDIFPSGTGSQRKQTWQELSELDKYNEELIDYRGSFAYSSW